MTPDQFNAVVCVIGFLVLCGLIYIAWRKP